ncbi:unnamed protein product [Brugia pahangi]|uniref:Uncharacterized protein n=1 Tax=Brugia pahangi TaxID=6280 RepID=A0A0N4TGP5_BRUPA|nr:unnamed protein product [Brugia pahangi]
MTLLLSQWTDIKKKKIDGNKCENITSYNDIECCSSVYRVGKSCYTMVDDEVVDETEQLGCCLDFNVVFLLLLLFFFNFFQCDSHI